MATSSAMISNGTIRSGRPWTTLVAILCVSTCALGGNSETLKTGLQAMKQPRFESAERAFNMDLEQATEANDPNALGRSYFYLGLNIQSQIESQPDISSVEARALYQRTLSYYLQASKYLPGSGGVLNNLALTYEKLGSYDQADQKYRSAINRANDRQVLYTVNYAAFLARRNQPSRAEKMYKLAQEFEPINQRAHEGLLTYYLKDKPAELGDYLRRRLEQGWISQVFNSTIDILMEHDRNLKDDHGRELVTILVMCLTKLNSQPQDFPESPHAERLGLLAAETGKWRHAIAGIFEVYDMKPLNPDSYRWWSSATDVVLTYRVPPGGWPLDAFHSLIRSLAERAMKRERTTDAEDYYEMALHLVASKPDARALVGLADLYVRQDKKQALPQLLSSYEDNMFNAKGAAIQKRDYEKMYECHRALGILYNYLGKQGNVSTVRSAEFQLSNALEAATNYNKSIMSQARNRPEPIIDLRLVEDLAQLYKGSNRGAKELDLRTEIADRYIKLGKPDEATRLFRPVKDIPMPESITPGKRRQHDRLRNNFGSLGFGADPRAMRTMEARPSNINVRGGLTSPSLRESDVSLIVTSLRNRIDQKDPLKGTQGYFLLPNDFQKDGDVIRINLNNKQTSVLLKQYDASFQAPVTPNRLKRLNTDSFRKIEKKQ
ncbi:MAG: hypothetical protein GY809_04210 [Planctomycetes bacterium]|nr:hypothetical protein [Planctomycetota bacterium]